MHAPLLALLALAPTAYGVARTDRWVSTDRLALGVQADGSLVNEFVGLGLLWDPDGPEGPLPVGGDWLLAGQALEAWSVGYTRDGSAHVLVQALPYESSDLEFAWDGPYDSGAVTWLHGMGANADLQVDTWIEAPWGRDVAWLVLRFQALADLGDLEVARIADPDPDAWITGSYATINTAGDGWAVAEGAWDARALALAASGGQGGICAWCTTPEGVASGSTGPIEGDWQIGVWMDVGDLAAGEAAQVTFALGLALGSADAVALAEEAAHDDDHDADGQTAADGDCDDRDAGVNGGALEVADGLDNDCDGSVDEDCVQSDDDGDGYSEADGDCDDGDPDVHPGAQPVEGVIDADCDGLADTGTWPPALDTGEGPEEEPGGCGCGTARSANRASLAGMLVLLCCVAILGRSR